MTLKAFQRALQGFRMARRWDHMRQAIWVVADTVMTEARVANILDCDEKHCEFCYVAIWAQVQAILVQAILVQAIWFKFGHYPPYCFHVVHAAKCARNCGGLHCSAHRLSTAARQRGTTSPFFAEGYGTEIFDMLYQTKQCWELCVPCNGYRDQHHTYCPYWSTMLNKSRAESQGWLEITSTRRTISTIPTIPGTNKHLQRFQARQRALSITSR